MTERVSRQRREAASRISRRMIDPAFREMLRTESESGERPVVIALWTDPLERVIRLIDEAGGAAAICVVPKRGRISVLNLKERRNVLADEPRPESDDHLVAAPESTIGLLIDSLAQGTEEFHLFLQESELSGYEVQFAEAPA